MKFKVFKRRIKDKMFGNTKDTAIGVQKLEMADARMGAIYFLAHTEMSKKKEGAFSVDLMGNFVVGTTAIADAKNGCQYLLEKTNAGRKMVSAVSVVGEKTQVVIDKIKSMIAGFFQNLMDKLRSIYGHKLTGIEWVAEFGAWAVAEFAGNLSSFIPGWGYVQNAADIYDGVRTAVLKSKDFVNQMYSGYGVNLLGGHPSIIANALARHSLAGVASGVKDATIGITKTALEAAGDAFAGAGTLVSALTGILQRIVNLVDYIIQYTRVNKVLAQAKDAWLKRDNSTSLVNNHKAFSEWFQNAVVCTPIVAALVMGSGFVAHPYRFLQLLEPNDVMVSKGAFDKGVKHIETLKRLSSNYVSEYTDGYGATFTGTDGVVSATLEQLVA